MLLAYEKGAELIVAVGTHTSLIDFLDKGRGGMSSTFLARLRVGSRLVDARGVSKLYPPQAAKARVGHARRRVRGAVPHRSGDVPGRSQPARNPAKLSADSCAQSEDAVQGMMADVGRLAAESQELRAES